MTILEITREAAKRDLHFFLKTFWNTFETEKFSDNWHLEYLCEVFMWNVRTHLPDYILSDWMDDETFNERLKLLEGFNVQNIRSTSKYDKVPKYLNINIAPRSSKSSIFNIVGPTWLFTHSPIKVLSISHKRELSTAMNAGRQALLSSDLYKELFPDVMLTTNTTQKLVGSHHGQMSSVSFKVTGFGGDVVINDDIIDATEAVKNKQELANAINFYEKSLPSRIIHPDTSIIMNIQQRLSKGDITGVIMGNPALRRQYEFIVLKAVAEEDEVFVFPCSGRIKVRKSGEVLWERNKNMYLKTKETDPTTFQTQYQQNPMADEDTIIKEEDVQYINLNDAREIMEDPDYIYASHDLPVKDNEASDFVGSVLAFRRGPKLIIADALELKMNYPRQKQHVITMDNENPGIIQIIEDKANGSPLYDDLKESVPSLVLYNPGSNSKTQRLQLAKDRMRNVYFVRVLSEDGKSWTVPPRLAYLIEQLTKYPYVTHDDIHDAFSMLVNYSFTQSRGGFFAGTYTKGNLIDTQQAQLLLNAPGSDVIGALNRVGNLWKGLKVVFDSQRDAFVIVDELVMVSNQNEAISKYIEFFKGCRFVMDGSMNSLLSLTISQQIMLLESFDERRPIEQLSQLQSGFALGKILIPRHCIDTRRDIDALSLDKDKSKSGYEEYKGDPGLVSCITSIVYMMKGDTEFFKDIE